MFFAYQHNTSFQLFNILSSWLLLLIQQRSWLLKTHLWIKSRSLAHSRHGHLVVAVRCCHQRPAAVCSPKQQCPETRLSEAANQAGDILPKEQAHSARPSRGSLKQCSNPTPPLPLCEEPFLEHSSTAADFLFPLRTNPPSSTLLTLQNTNSMCNIILFFNYFSVVSVTVKKYQCLMFTKQDMFIDTIINGCTCNNTFF